MVVAFVFNHHIVSMENKVKLMGDRHIVGNKGDSPFTMMQYMVGRKNLLTPYFAKELRRMFGAGLSQLWLKVGLQNMALREKVKPKEARKYFEAVQKAFGNLRESVTFHESRPVSVTLILPGFVLCSILMTIGLVIFIVEYGMELLKFF